MQTGIYLIYLMYGYIASHHGIERSYEPHRVGYLIVNIKMCHHHAGIHTRIGASRTDYLHRASHHL